MYTKFATAGSLCLLTALAGCSSLGGLADIGKVDYKSGAGQRSAALDVPPDLTRPGRDDRYALEGETASASLSEIQSGSRRDATAQGAAASSGVLPESEKIRIGRAGNQRWLIVPGQPAAVWPRLQQFWTSNGFVLAVDEPAVGVMETEWKENRAKIPQDIVRRTVESVFEGAYSSSERDKFRTRLDTGASPGTVEVYVTHRGVEEVLTGAQKDSSTWTWRPSDPGLEAEMLRRMLLAFGVQEDRARELLTTTTPTDRARFERAPDGGAALVFAEGFDQAWRQVGVALDRTGFVVEEADRALGLYDVRAGTLKPTPAAKQSEGGWLASLKFWESREPQATPKPGLAVQSGAAYRIFVKGDGARSTVRVLDAEGNIDKSDEANRILKGLFEQLK